MVQAICHHPLTEETRVLVIGVFHVRKMEEVAKGRNFSRVIRFSSVRILPNGTIVYIQLS